jgi:hypothetical protein
VQTISRVDSAGSKFIEPLNRVEARFKEVASGGS